MSSSSSQLSTQSSHSPLPDTRLTEPKLPEPTLPNDNITESRLTETRLPESRLPEPRLPDSRLPDIRLPEPSLSDQRLSPRPFTMKSEVTGPIEMNGTNSPLNLHREGMLLKRDVGGSEEKSSTHDTNKLTDRNGSMVEADDIKPLNMSSVSRPEVKVHNERKRRASSDSLDSQMTKASESAADDASKDDDEENDDDDDEKMSTSHNYDPERLKSFNMFVRLFVDENLDRVVPISKQPKDKIQAILDACDRQFPEFHERSRKRIRTYLKSCRRMRRSKDAIGWDQLRPTPPHLTSAAAESLLAIACENESNNAKRMRMGLEPIPVTPASSSHSPVSNPIQTTSSARASPTQTPLSMTHSHTTAMSPPQAPSLDKQPTVASEFPRHTPTLPTAFRPPHELPSPFFSNTNGMFRPGFPSSYQSPAHHHSPVALPHSQLASQLQNGPTDLSMKKSSLTSPSSKNQLNSTEVSTIKQLIAGYRESAAFLYRSADELEQLLLHQN